MWMAPTSFRSPNPLAFLLPLLLHSSSMFILVSADENHRPGFAYSRSTGRCTPRYWSSRSELWPRMVPHTSTLSKVFGSRALERFRSDHTLLEATTRKDEEESSPFRKVLKQATASLLNSYGREAFPYSPWQVKTLLIQALVSEQAAAAAQAERFYLANEACN